MKKVGRIFLCLMVMFIVISVLRPNVGHVKNIMADGIVQEGENGDLKWSLKDGVLTISGTGEIPIDFFEENSIELDAPKELVIKEGITSIGYAAFWGCDEVKKVTLSSGLEKIDQKAFLGCKKLDYIEIPDTVTYIGRNAFEACYRLKYVKLSKSMKFISASTFENCSSLSGIDIPEGIESIYGNAFLFCTKLKTMKIPKSLDYIGSVIEYQHPVTLLAKDENLKIKDKVSQMTDLTYVEEKNWSCDHNDEEYDVKTATKDKDGKAIFICRRCGETSLKTLSRPEKAVLKNQEIRYQKGKDQNPWIDIIKNDGTKLKQRYYEVVYPSESMHPGTYQATVKFRNGYEGTMNVEYKILKAKQHLYRISNKVFTKPADVPFYSNISKTGYHNQIHWTSSDPKIAVVDSKGQITGKRTGTCKIYGYAIEDNDYERSATISTTVKIIPGKVKNIRLKTMSGGKIRITWWKDSRIDGYYISCSRKKNMINSKMVTVSNYKTTKTTIKNLKKKSKYYIEIYAYKKIREGKRYHYKIGPITQLTIKTK